MSQENVEVARRAVAFFVGLGGPIEADQAADRMSDSALQEFLDPEVELIPVAQGLLGGNTYKGYEGIAASGAISSRPGTSFTLNRSNSSTRTRRLSSSCA
jgi:hypothetical protein